MDIKSVLFDGRFASVTTRSVPRKEKPYPQLVEVARTQPVFHLQDVSGTLAGFRFPDFARGLNVPGFHLHFLAEDRRAGGHVIDLKLLRGELSIDATARSHPGLPTDTHSFTPTWATTLATCLTGPSGGSDPLFTGNHDVGMIRNP